MGILSLTIISFLLGKEIKNNLFIKREEEDEKINFNKMILATFSFYIGTLI